MSLKPELYKVLKKAKEILENKGEVEPTAFLFSGNILILMIEIGSLFAEGVSRHNVSKFLEYIVEEYNADMIIIGIDAYTVERDANSPIPESVKDQPDKKECLIVAGKSISGESMAIVTIYHRLNNKIQYEETIELQEVGKDSFVYIRFLENIFTQSKFKH